MTDAASACRICLVTPPVFVPAAFAPVLGRAIGAADVAAVRLRMPGASVAERAAAAAALRAITNRADIALLLDGDPALAVQLGCDGVHVQAGDVAAARRIVGSGASVGAACGWSRDAAMDAAEAGADYVAFGPATGSGEAGRQAIADWALAMVVPGVVAGGIDASSARGWAAAGADFLAVGRAVWQDPAGPEAALRDLARSLRGG